MINPRLAILAPSPVVTVTVERGDAHGDETHFHAGGQGVWVARMAAAIGAEVVLCVTLAGETGTVLGSLLSSPGVEVRKVHAHGRSGSYIHDRRHGERIPVASATGPHLWRHETDELYGMMLSAALDADVALLTGPQPPDALSSEFYRRLAADMRSNGATVAADLTGPALRGALAGGLDLLKISHNELIDEGLAATPERGQQLEAMRELRRRGARTVLLSRAADSALALLDDRVYELSGPRFEAADPRGAGDSMFAAVGVALARGAEPIDAVRLGVAAGALNVTRRGLGTGHRSEIERLVTHVDVIELSDQAVRS